MKDDDRLAEAIVLLAKTTRRLVETQSYSALTEYDQSLKDIEEAIRQAEIVLNRSKSSGKSE